MGGAFLFLLRRRVAMAPFLFAALLTSCAAMAAPVTNDADQGRDLRVMSFNVRFAKAGHSEEAKENNWDDAEHPRRERAIRVVRDYGPDLWGVQEARIGQIEDFRKALPEYEFYGLGRDDGKTGGEFSGIFYRKSRFTQKDAGSFWLSDTPEKPGTSFYKDPKAVPRVASWVRLADAKSNREFVLLNMHWDHVDVPAREKSAALVRERLTKIAQDVPVIVMGDLNSGEKTKAFTTLVEADGAGRKLADSYREVHPKRLPNEASFDAWNGKRDGSRIDFILHTADFTPSAAEIDRTSYDGRWPSDHYPVTATLRLNAK